MNAIARWVNRIALPGFALTVLAACGGGTGGGGNAGGGGTAATYAIGGTVSGLTGSGLVLANGADTVSPAAGATSFTFPTALASGSSYAVTVQTQPPNEACQVAQGSGQVGSAAVASVTVTCVTITSEGAWTWVSGSNIADAKGVYGTQGVAAAGNVAGARNCSVSWIDSAGDLWLFGGIRTDYSTGSAGYFNDLWRYSPGSGLWTWISGSNTNNNAAGVYGTRGVAAAGNVPGAHCGSVSWIDAAGNLWLFGGVGFDAAGNSGLLNDLWRYSPSSGLWTWISGSNTINAPGAYGTQGVAAAANVPGARIASVSWIDSAGNLWLFGGNAFGAAGPRCGCLLNDLWRYSPSSGLWTWVSGANTINAPGLYGTQGVAAASNVPGARVGPASWIDSAGDLWLFGGDGRDSVGSEGGINDLWSYSPGTGMWTWVSGANTINAPGVYGTQGVAAAGNVPGARESSFSWIDSAGNLWLFGGNGSGYNGLWRYSPSSGLWTWISGDELNGAPVGVYGTQGVGAVGNMPGGRVSSVSWIDNAGNLWLFGGGGWDSVGAFADLNDLWRFSPGGGP